MNIIKNFAEKGLKFHKNNQLEEAKKQYLEVLNVDPKNFQIKRLLGLIEFGLENYENSLFQKSSKGTFLSRFFSQITMLFNELGSDGGLFIMIGKKKH